MIVTLEQARAMRWPFRSPRQPIGLLLDQGTITVHDLQRASRAAYSPRFKAACLLLLREMTPTSHVPTTSITREVQPPDRPPSPPPPQTCPICEGKLHVNDGIWECVSDKTHYWQHRVQCLRAARQQWIERLSPDERQYHDDIWMTTSDHTARENFLSDHALKYPAGS